MDNLLEDKRIQENSSEEYNMTFALKKYRASIILTFILNVKSNRDILLA